MIYYRILKTGIYDREQLLCVSLCERLDNLACLGQCEVQSLPLDIYNHHVCAHCPIVLANLKCSESASFHDILQSR